MDTVKKTWGKEIIIVSNDSYCGKFLHVDKGAQSSYHFHPKKKETFYCMQGEVILQTRNKEMLLREPYTLNPNTPHRFYGVTDAVILEISTPHSDEDVIRLDESIAGAE